MYSPRINEKLIPLLYRKARELKIPMTRLVNRIIADALGKEEAEEDKSKSERRSLGTDQQRHSAVAFGSKDKA